MARAVDPIDQAIDNPLWDLNELLPSFKRRISSSVGAFEYDLPSEYLWHHVDEMCKDGDSDLMRRLEVRVRRPYLLSQIREHTVPGAGRSIGARAVVIAEVEEDDEASIVRVRLALPGPVVWASVVPAVIATVLIFIAWRTDVSVAEVWGHPLRWGALFLVVLELYWFLVEIPRALREWDHQALDVLRAIPTLRSADRQPT